MININPQLSLSRPDHSPCVVENQREGTDRDPELERNASMEREKAAR